MQTSEILRPCQPMDCIATIVASEWLTPTIKSIRLQLDAATFGFLPGQSVWPKFERDGKSFTKIYSMASSPSACPEIELCVSRVGWSSAFLQDLQPGDTIPVRGPYGLMTLSELPTRDRLYLAEGSGIAPLKSQIDWLHECRFAHSIVLVQANPETADQLPYRDHWRSLAAQWPNFRYLEAINLAPEALLTTVNLDWAQTEVEICAVGDRPSQLYDAMMSLGASPRSVRMEKFVAF
ncbi:ferredoxin--NADP reductase [Leptolyngbya sp. AN02str]|uniref:ferredoxin--NADP reductase n=1 Tax=Leptolyngbya sp. AN02str TaxID=3423363 RepID=UPI003D31BE15